MSRRIHTLAATAALAAIVTACASSMPPSSTPAARPATTASAATSASAAATVSVSRGPAASGPAALLFGTYAATIPSGVNAQPGKWKLTVGAGGVTFTRPEGESFSPGAVKELTANEIVLAPDPGCPVQEGTPTEGRYQWSRDGDVLRLKLVADSCQDRIDTLTISEWSLIP